MRFLLLPILLCWLLPAAAQQNRPPAAPSTPPPGWALSASPLALLQPDVTAMVGAEYGLNQQVRFTLDAGYILAMLGNSQLGDSRPRGFVFRPGVKWQLKKGDHFYLHVQGLWKEVHRHRTLWVERNSGAYQQEMRLLEKRVVYGVQLIVGKPLPWNRRRHDWFLDPYLGFGLRWKSMRYPALAPDDEPPAGSRFWRTEGLLPSLPMGLRLLYCF